MFCQSVTYFQREENSWKFIVPLLSLSNIPVKPRVFKILFQPKLIPYSFLGQSRQLLCKIWEKQRLVDFGELVDINAMLPAEFKWLNLSKQWLIFHVLEGIMNSPIISRTVSGLNGVQVPNRINFKLIHTCILFKHWWLHKKTQTNVNHVIIVLVKCISS